MRIISQSEAFLYGKKGFSTSNIQNGTSINMVEMYDYLKRMKKRPEDLTRQEYLMFRNGKNN